MLTDFEYMQGLKLGSRMAALGETRRSLWPSRTTESGSAAATAPVRPRTTALARFWKNPAIQQPTLKWLLTKAISLFS